eukprot:4883534-Karenia_brevis.AAC.1
MTSCTPVAVRIEKMGYAPGASLKPPTDIIVFEKLIDQFLTDGFLTAQEPLTINQPDALQPQQPGATLADFSLGQIKGQGRIQSLHCLLGWMWQNQVDIERDYPLLCSTVQAIYVWPFKTETKMQEAIYNMKVSVRGSIRQSCHLIQIVGIALNLMKNHGLPDLGMFVRH